MQPEQRKNLPDRSKSLTPIYARDNWEAVRTHMQFDTSVVATGGISGFYLEGGLFPKIMVGTTNPVKMQTISHALARVGSEVTQLAGDFPEVQGTMEEVTESKWRSYARKSDGWLLVEDSGFHFDCMNGFPGPYGKCLLEHVGLKGMIDIAERMKNPAAAISCCMCFGHTADTAPTTFISYDHGRVMHPDLPGNVGWDSIFYPSHRGGSAVRISQQFPDVSTCRTRVIAAIADQLALSFLSISTRRSDANGPQ